MIQSTAGTLCPSYLVLQLIGDGLPYQQVDDGLFFQSDSFQHDQIGQLVISFKDFWGSLRQANVQCGVSKTISWVGKPPQT
jgi:hypothetical protein